MDINAWFRRIYAAMWLTWKDQSGWTHPIIFLVYSTISPFFQLILYAYIFIAVAFYGGTVDYKTAFYLITGIAFYNFVGSGLYGLIWTVHSEREYFRTLKYAYIGFPNLQLYLLSRSLVNYLIGLFTTIMILVSGFLLIGLPQNLFSPNIPLLLILLIIGFIWSSQLGIILAGSSIFSSEYGPLISEAVGGLLFLLGAVLYPISSLPLFLRPFTEIFPMKEWTELMRFSLNINYRITAPSIVMNLLIFKTIIYIVISMVFFRLVEYLARKKGLLEATYHH